MNFVDDLEHARVHPKFLHSNATSHKWAFGGNNNIYDLVFRYFGEKHADAVITCVLHL